ncbi:MAG: D-2-hydroxyacid dehydrogenase [Oscillospiraceae bacterium]|nr:D-2-hydroxyacid dehydrogenase [Oscillospiraceae bacterium]
MIDVKNVLVTLPVREEHKTKIREAAQGCRVLFVPLSQVTAEQIAEANVIIGNVPAKMIRASESLELLQLESAGADAYLAPGLLAGSTVLCNATGAYNRTVSEHAVALTLMLMKKLHLYRDVQKECLWKDCGGVSSPVGAVVLVVGLGEIGLQYAKIMKAMGAYIIGVKRRPGSCPEGIDELVQTDDIDSVLPRADVVFSILPSTKGTVHFYTAERFRLMKNSALFINCGRGNAVESDVLLQALQDGEIAGAAVDVTEPEPLPADHPLWLQENMVITPHVAGGYHHPHTYECIVDIACENLARWIKGEDYRNVVDFETGYKR